MAICYDRHFALSISNLAKQGAELVFSPAVTFGAKSHRMWHLEFPTHATRYNIFIGGSNRYGAEPPWNQPYFGDSYFVGPNGRFTNLSNHPKLVVAEVDFEELTRPDPPAGSSAPTTSRPVQAASRIPKRCQFSICSPQLAAPCMPRWRHANCREPLTRQHDRRRHGHSGGLVGFGQQLIRQDMDRDLETMQHTPGDTYADVTATLTRDWQDAAGTQDDGAGRRPLQRHRRLRLDPRRPAAAGRRRGSRRHGRRIVRGSRVTATAADWPRASNIEAWTGTVQMTQERYEAEAARLKSAKQEELQKLKESLVLGTAGIDEREDTVAIGGVNIPTQ